MGAQQQQSLKGRLRMTVRCQTISSMHLLRVMSRGQSGYDNTSFVYLGGAFLVDARSSCSWGFTAHTYRTCKIFLKIVHFNVANFGRLLRQVFDHATLEPSDVLILMFRCEHEIIFQICFRPLLPSFSFFVNVTHLPSHSIADSAGRCRGLPRCGSTSTTRSPSSDDCC
jgi:hypothetical protein